MTAHGCSRASLAVVLIALGCLAAPPALAAQATLAVGDVRGESGSVVAIPVRLEAPGGIGPLQFHLRYQPAVLAVTGVRAAEGIQGLVQYAEVEPGHLSIVLTSDQALHQDGAVVLVTAQVRGRDGASSPLVLERARAWLRDTSASMEVLVSARNGTLHVGSSGGNRGVLLLGLGALALVLLGLVVTRRKPRLPVVVSTPASPRRR